MAKQKGMDKFDITMHTVAAAIIVAYIVACVFSSQIKSEDAKNPAITENRAPVHMSREEIQRYKNYYQRHMEKMHQDSLTKQK